jgi:hypothetical protein
MVPDGNGRSLAFPLLWSLPATASCWLIDDRDHYPFLPEMRRVFALPAEQVGTAGNKRWKLVQAKPHPAGNLAMGPF